MSCIDESVEIVDERDRSGVILTTPKPSGRAENQDPAPPSLPVDFRGVENGFVGIVLSLADKHVAVARKFMELRMQ